MPDSAGIEAQFLRNAWYVAGFAEELDRTPLLGRRILDLPILLFRDSKGRAAAIGDRCPHRFAPLHLGRLEGDQVRCGYHGLAFGRTGRCVDNPHGPTGALAVPSYPLEEKSGLLWIWLGTAEQADPALIPSFDCLDESRWLIGRGYLGGNAHYELMSDNILDLSHIEFLHPSLGSDAVSRARVEVRQDGESVIATRRMTDELLPPNLARVYRSGDQPVNRTMEVSWHAPANLLLDVAIEPAGGSENWRTGSQSLHLFTPESACKTHYFYIGALSRDWADASTAAGFFDALGRAFATEDKPMIDAQQAMLGDSDLMALKPALLPIDKAAVLARRRLAALIAAERASVD
jgi:vanillate O-demethylase monooxygenase subunit